MKTHGLIGSMGRVASTGDNPALESFFTLLQHNALDRHAWKRHKHRMFAILSSSMSSYHRLSCQRGLSRMRP